jgi:formylglycine-generating enzyme required for sulfatase activity
VTNNEFRRLFPTHEGEDELPAAQTTWYEAYTYSAWLGGRLPTEAEWEHVARLNCAHTYCRQDGGPAELGEVAWWAGNSLDDLAGTPLMKPVMSLEPGPLGLWDLYGNAWEWNANWTYRYTAEAEVDPAGPTKAAFNFRSYRGGAASTPREWLVPSGRGQVRPEARSRFGGFRVVLTEATLPLAVAEPASVP